MTTTHTFDAEILTDGRKRVTVTTHSDERWLDGRVSTYTTVRNIDGSSRLMRDGSYWSFLPCEMERGAYAAIREAEAVGA